MLDRAPKALVFEDETGCGPHYFCLDAVDLLERLHRLGLDLIKSELRRFGFSEISPVQAMLLVRIGDRQITPGEIASYGYYPGSNLSNALKKLVESGYLRSRRHAADGRSVFVSLTERGTEVREVLAALFEWQADELEVRAQPGDGSLYSLYGSLRELERLWTEQGFRG